MAMRILCLNATIFSVDDKLRLLIGADSPPNRLCLGLGPRNDRRAQSARSFDLPLSVEAVSDVLVSSFHFYLQGS